MKQVAQVAQKPKRSKETEQNEATRRKQSIGSSRQRQKAQRTDAQEHAKTPTPPEMHSHRCKMKCTLNYRSRVLPLGP
jgi:hypothetical protein